MISSREFISGGNLKISVKWGTWKRSLFAYWKLLRMYVKIIMLFKLCKKI